MTTTGMPACTHTRKHTHIYDNYMYIYENYTHIHIPASELELNSSLYGLKSMTFLSQLEEKNPFGKEKLTIYHEETELEPP